MPMERFLGEGTFSNTVQIEKTNVLRRAVPRSAVYIMGNVYINQGSEGLQAVSREVNQMGLAVESQEEFLALLNSEQSAVFFLNQAGLFLGLSLHAIEDCLVNKEFDSATFVAEFNDATRGTHMKKATYIGDGKEHLTDEQYRQIITHVTGDPTFSSLFMEGFEHLPKRLRDLLNKTGAIEIIRDYLLDVYKPQAEVLIDEINRLRKETQK